MGVALRQVLPQSLKFLEIKKENGLACVLEITFGVNQLMIVHLLFIKSINIVCLQLVMFHGKGILRGSAFACICIYEVFVYPIIIQDVIWRSKFECICICVFFVII